jgi:hypothetical protein
MIHAALAIAFVLALATQARAEPQTRFYGPDGRSTGTAVPSSDGSVRYYDAQGRSVGTSSTDSAGTTKFYDASGRAAGSVQPTRR